MARPVIIPTYPDDTAYMQLFNSWGSENNQTYAAFSGWLDGDMDTFMKELDNYINGVNDYISCVYSNWKSQASVVVSRNRVWVEAIGKWIEEVRMLLPDDQKEVALMSWDDWYKNLKQWMQDQENWYNAVDADLSTLSVNVETLLQNILSTLQAWVTAMQNWRNSWPTI